MRAMALVGLLVMLPLSGCLTFPGQAVRPTDYLKGDYKTWHVEVDYSSGQRPDDNLLRFIDDRLTPLVNKANGVSVQHDDALTSTATTWTDTQIKDYARAHASFTTGGETVVTHLLFLAGNYAGDSDGRRVLGVTYNHDLIVIFPESIKASCVAISIPPCTNPAPMMQATTLHEFGHALGLVNHGTPMVRNHEATTCGDKPDKGHSANRDSVMYCAVETSDITTLLTGGIPQNFDADDRDDLRAAGGK